ncbi:MAG TPA: hypothetical protein PK156_06320 [Polyangium sp.]|nr:hypothetical protein [Polyangium sp.]
MIRRAAVLALSTLNLLSYVPVAHADLTPPGGEGVSECRNKKAGDACQNFVIVGMEQKLEPGTCVEEKLDHLHFKFKAHLRCVSASVPRPPPSAAKPAPSAGDAPATSATASAAPSVAMTNPIPSAAPPASSAATDPPKQSGCALASDPANGVALGFFMLGLGVLWRARRRTR